MINNESIAISRPLFGEEISKERLTSEFMERLKIMPEFIKSYLYDFRYKVIFCPPKSPSFISMIAVTRPLALGLTFGKHLWIYMNTNDDSWIERALFTAFHELFEWIQKRSKANKQGILSEFFP
ncbi:MAG: hypothetical protein ACP6IU_03785, partial [Candidatus Asgardarchaeia archaeon]